MTLSELCQLMHRKGARTIYLKALAENDNTKQQLYMGSDFHALSIFPFGEITAYPALKVPNLKASIDLHWIEPDTGTSHKAPGAQLILYPKYPEVRLSGFLAGCSAAPSEYMQPVPKDERKSNNGKDGRVLFLGVCEDGRILALLAPAGSVLALEALAAANGMETVGVFHRVSEAYKDARAHLLQLLEGIHRQGWHPSIRLDKQGNPQPYRANNGGGYTLEALLGIIPNGRSEPDFEGWEIKGYSGSVLTLMTPEPDGGFYGEKGVRAFLERYAVQKKDDPNTLYFTGIHRANAKHDKTGMNLVLRGYDASKHSFEVSGGVDLMDAGGGLAASWSFAALMEKWNRKHQQAVYVPYVKRDETNGRQYSYVDPLRLGTGTDFGRFLGACHAGHLYYDPAPKLTGLDSGKPVTKARSQFRMALKNLPQLYDNFELYHFDGNIHP